MSLIEKNNNKPFSVIHKAGWVLADPEHMLENGYVKIESGKIVDVGQGRAHGNSAQIIDHGPGVLMPGLVNAHTHLELSALKGQTDIASGFLPWVASVIEKKEQTGEAKLLAGMQTGIQELADSGTLVVGDIAGMTFSRQVFLNSMLSGVRFAEFLGTDADADINEAVGFETDSTGKNFSLAGHAPHTTASDLLVKLKSVTAGHGLAFSIHLAESHDEVEFLTTGKGAWSDFLHQRKIDTSAIKITKQGPVSYADRLGLLDDKTLAVHLVLADQKDIALLAEKKVHVCLCLRSNQMLHQRLPDVPRMVKSGLNLCLGTDSLASSASLSLFDEMAFFARSFPEIAPVDIIAMATVNGASALGFENRFGRLMPGYFAKMIYLPLGANTPGRIYESIVTADFYGAISRII